MNAIKMTVGQLVESQGALSRLAGTKMSDLPPETAQKVGYHVKRLLSYAKSLLKTYEEQRLELIQQFGFERDPTTAERRVNGGQKVWQVLPENGKEYGEALKKLEAVAITIEWGPISTNDLGTQHGLTLDDFATLGPLVVFPEEKGE